MDEELIVMLQRFALLSRGEAMAVLRAYENGEKCYVEAVAHISPDPAQFIAAALAEERALRWEAAKGGHNG